MESKSFMQSKTININAILIGVIGILAALGIDLPSGAYEALLAAIPLANIILRLVTKKPITLTGTPAANNKGSTHLIVVILLLVFSSTLFGCSLFDQIRTRAETSNAQLRDQYCAGGPSLILDHIPNAKQADIIVQIADYAILQNNPQLVEPVIDFFTSARTHLTNDQAVITGHDVVVFMAKNIAWIKDTAGKHLFFISQLAGEIDLPDPLTACDRKLLLLHIDNVEAKVFPFVGAQ